MIIKQTTWTRGNGPKKTYKILQKLANYGVYNKNINPLHEQSTTTI